MYQILEILSKTEKALPQDFQEGVISIFKIQCFNLKNTEILGTPDPYIRVRVGAYAERTYTIQNGGSNALFEPLDTKLTVTAETLRLNEIEFEVWDENSKLDVRGDVMIGKGSRSLDDVRVLEELVELSIPLTDSKGGPSGRLLAFLKLQNPPPTEPGTNSGINTISGSETDLSPKPEIISLLPDFTEGTIHIRKISLYGLENTEIFSMFEKQDPYISLRVIGGNLEWERKTPVLNNGGENNMWELSGFEIDVTRHQLSECVLEVTVKDKNKMREDIIIGCGEIEFKILSKLNTILEIPVMLKSTNEEGVTKNKSTGRLVCYIELKNREKKENFLQQGFQNGEIEILKIQTYDLKNTEVGLLSSNHNPYCKLKLGDTQNTKTGTLKNAGENFSWDMLTVKFDVTSEMLMQNNLEVSFYDDNVLCKDRLLGEGKASLLQCGSKVGEVVNFTVYLVDSKARPCGRALIHAKISEEVNDDDVIISEEFVDGNIRIKRITVSDVPVNNGLLLSTSQLYIKMKMESFNECTSKINQENSNNLIWNNLDYSIHFDKNTLSKKNIEVEVWRSCTLRKDVLLGTAIISMRKAGGNLNKEIALSQYLNFKKNSANNIGKVTLLCQLIPSKIVLKQAELGIYFTYFKF